MTNEQIEIFMQEILEAINEASNKSQEQFNKIEQDINDLRKDMNKRLDYHETWLKQIEKNMASKSQVNSLLGILIRKNIISNYEASHVTQSA